MDCSLALRTSEIIIWTVLGTDQSEQKLISDAARLRKASPEPEWYQRVARAVGLKERRSEKEGTKES